MEKETHWQVVNLTKIGNSYGVILTKKMLKHMKIQETMTQVGILLKGDGTLGIKSAKKVIPLNLDVSTWEKKIKQAIAKGHLPEPCIWPDYMSEDADKDWTWPEEFDKNGNLIPSAETTLKKPAKRKKK